MAGVIDELPVDVAERISTPEEEALRHCLPHLRLKEIFPILTRTPCPQLTRFELPSQWLLLLTLYPPAPLLLCRIMCHLKLLNPCW